MLWASASEKAYLCDPRFYALIISPFALCLRRLSPLLRSLPIVIFGHDAYPLDSIGSQIFLLKLQCLGAANHENCLAHLPRAT